MKNEFPKIRSFEDLNSWREAKKLCLTLMDMFREKKPESLSAGILAEEIIRLSINLTGRIASSFSSGNIGLFVSGLKQSLAQSRGLLSLLYLLDDVGLVSEDSIRGAIRDTGNVTRAIKENIKYLSNLEIKEKYREMDAL